MFRYNWWSFWNRRATGGWQSHPCTECNTRVHGTRNEVCWFTISASVLIHVSLFLSLSLSSFLPALILETTEPNGWILFSQIFTLYLPYNYKTIFDVKIRLKLDQRRSLYAPACRQRPSFCYPFLRTKRIAEILNRSL